MYWLLRECHVCASRPWQMRMRHTPGLRYAFAAAMLQVYESVGGRCGELLYYGALQSMAAARAPGLWPCAGVRLSCGRRRDSGEECEGEHERERTDMEAVRKAWSAKRQCLAKCRRSRVPVGTRTPFRPLGGRQ